MDSNSDSDSLDLMAVALLKVKTWGVVTAVLVLGMVIAAILYAVTIRWLDDDPITFDGEPVDVALLQAQFEQLDRQKDSQLIIFGLATGILGIAATGIIAINVIGLIAANKNYERDKDALETIILSKSQSMVDAAATNAADANTWLKVEIGNNFTDQLAAARKELEAGVDKNAELISSEITPIIARLNSHSEKISDFETAIRQIQATVSKQVVAAHSTSAELAFQRKQWMSGIFFIQMALTELPATATWQTSSLIHRVLSTVERDLETISTDFGAVDAFMDLVDVLEARDLMDDLQQKRVATLQKALRST